MIHPSSLSSSDAALDAELDATTALKAAFDLRLDRMMLSSYLRDAEQRIQDATYSHSKIAGSIRDFDKAHPEIIRAIDASPKIDIAAFFAELAATMR